MNLVPGDNVFIDTNDDPDCTGQFFGTVTYVGLEGVILQTEAKVGRNNVRVRSFPLLFDPSKVAYIERFGLVGGSGVPFWLGR